MICPRLATLRSFTAVGGMVTPMTASPAFADASRWLTGQIPQVRAVRLGISQTGRYLRQYLYQDFNRDTEGRRVFDGLMVHTAGAGRGSFNHRFGQPSRDAHPFSAFFYPTDIFPFTGTFQFDPESGRVAWNPPWRATEPRNQGDGQA